MHEQQERIFSSLEKTIGLDSDSQLGLALWKPFESYTDLLSEVVGDEDQWLWWYCLENDMGRKKLAARSGGRRMRVITGLNDLVWLLQKDDNK